MAAPMRDPSADPTPLDRASFYVESLKYGPGPGRVEGASAAQVDNQLEVLLRDAGVTSMTGTELRAATEYYGLVLARTLRAPEILMHSVFMDGLMHGIALAGGLEGEWRYPRQT